MDRYLGNAPKRPFEPIRLFRWRNYQDYGTAVAGDLLRSPVNRHPYGDRVSGPEPVYSTGGLRIGTMAATCPTRCSPSSNTRRGETASRIHFRHARHFKSSEPQERFGFKLVGSEGTILTDVRSVTLSKRPRSPLNSYTNRHVSKDQQNGVSTEYRKQYPWREQTVDTLDTTSEQRWVSSRDAHKDHINNFIQALRTRKPHFEDATFGFRAAGPALLCNTSYFEKRVCTWDANSMTAG